MKAYTYKNKSKGFTPTPFLALLRGRGASAIIPASHDARKGCRGFTLIEALVGIAVLLIAVTAALTTVSTNISYSGSAREEITAFFLAQEAVEIVRNTRDNNAISGSGWLQGLSDCTGGATCVISATDLSDPSSSCGNSCPNLLLNSAGVYQYTTGDETMFRREVNIGDIVLNKEATVTVTVYWPKGNLERSFTITENIFNWQD